MLVCARGDVCKASSRGDDIQTLDADSNASVALMEVAFV